MKTNEIKLDNYILPERVKAKMVLKLFNTQQEELGFALCSKDNIITTGKDLRGISGEMAIYPSDCKRDENFLGSYHTHPKRDSRASAKDVFIILNK
jgi:proteasome lid subunit RPN8/RPN11